MNEKNLTVLSAKSASQLKEGQVYYFKDCDVALLRDANYRDIDKKHVASLVESIRETGVQAEVVVTARKVGGKVELSVEDGHHRLAAVRQLRDDALKSNRAWLYRELPVRVRVVAVGPNAATDNNAAASTPSHDVVGSVLRNQLRKEESLWDRLAAAEALRKSGETAPSIARMMGLDERSVRRILSLGRIPAEVVAFAKRHGDRIKTASLYRLGAAMDGKDDASTLSAISAVLAKATGGNTAWGERARELAGRELAGGSSAKTVEMAALLALDLIDTSDLTKDLTNTTEKATPRSSGERGPNEPKAARRTETVTKRQDRAKSGAAPESLIERLTEMGMPEKYLEMVRHVIREEA